MNERRLFPEEGTSTGWVSCEATGKKSCTVISAGGKEELKGIMLTKRD